VGGGYIKQGREEKCMCLKLVLKNLREIDAVWKMF
jgi:hypothetical protein